MVTSKLKEAKRQARRLAEAMERAGTKVSLGRAYELTAQAAGHADWNTMAAALKAPAGAGLALGERVSGRYLGHAITGRVHALKRKGAEHVEIEIDLDVPVDVIASEAFSSFRKRIRATLGPDGRSVGRRSDGVPHLELE